MSNVIHMVIPTGKEVDVSLSYKTMPPLVVPISDRAKEILPTTDGEACLFLSDDAEDVLAMFPKDFVFFHDENYEPLRIVAVTINSLH